MISLNPIIHALIVQLRKRNLDIEYRGEPGRIYLVGDTKQVDEPTKKAVAAAKAKVLREILIPAYEQAGGKPVRLPAVEIRE